MVGIVIVSHSAEIARGVVKLAREMGGEDVALEAAGGLDEPDEPLGTDAQLVADAIGRAGSGDGVLVLMDLGSAVLSAEMALELLGEREEPVSLCAAALVEGAVAAAASARQGDPLDLVAEEALAGLGMKAGHLGTGTEAASEAPERRDETGSASGHDGSDESELRVEIQNPLGLHARPSARLVQTVGRFDADVDVIDETSGRGPVSARSLSAVATLGVRAGHTVRFIARGPGAEQVMRALGELAAENFGDAATERSAPGRVDGLELPSETPAGTEEINPGVLRGVAASPGIGIGPARRLGVSEPEVPEAAAGTPEEEWAKLSAALEEVRRQLETARASVAARGGRDASGILEAQLLLLADEGILEPVRESVFEGGASGPRAWRDAMQRVRRDYEELEDAYQQARAQDAGEVAARVLVAMAGEEPRPTFERGTVVVADELAPADAAGLDPDVEGIVTARGGATSHAAILARAAGIPAVFGAGAAVLGIEEGTLVAVDGERGLVQASPSDVVLADLEARRERSRAARAAAAASATKSAETRDGTLVQVMANVSSLAEAKSAPASGADGIGLLRTEILFLDRSQPPDEDEQRNAYEAIARSMKGKPVTVRTLDVGGDKPLGYVSQPAEDNPFLGLRGLRLGLARPELLGVQLAAVAQAAACHPIRVMFPMVTTIGEMRAARRALEDAVGRIDGGEKAGIEVGAMVEVPALALQAGALAAEVDFLSIGTNDLAQYVMAAERGNEHVAALVDALHPAVLRLIRIVCEEAGAHDCPVGVCGELAADPAAVAVLLGLGVTELSMVLPAIATTKQLVRDIDLPSARDLASAALRCSDGDEVRALAKDSVEHLSATQVSPAS